MELIDYLMNKSNNRACKLSVILFSVYVLTACSLEKNASTILHLYTPVPTATPTLIPTVTPVPAPIGQLSFVDRPDDYPGFYQVHVLYVVPKDFLSTTRYLDGSIDESMRLVNEWFASQKDGQFFVFDTYQGKLDITYIPLSVTEDEILEYTKEKYGKYNSEISGLVNLSVAMEDFIYQLDEWSFASRKVYVAYFEISKSHVCGNGRSGYGYLVATLFPSAYSLRDQIDCSEFSDQSLDGIRGVWENIIAHEIIHVLGVPGYSSCPKHPDGDGAHILDPETPDDIMGSGMYSENPVLDPNHDDYYMIDKTCFDLADSPYLYP